MAKKNRKKKTQKNKKKMAVLAPDVAITVAVAEPKEKKMGGGIMSPPEREGYAGGALVSLIKKIITPLNKAQKSTRPLTRQQAGYAKDMTGGSVVAGGLG